MRKRRQLRGQQMRMIRHHRKRMQLATLKSYIALHQRLHNQLRYLGAFQMQRPGNASIQ